MNKIDIISFIAGIAYASKEFRDKIVSKGISHKAFGNKEVETILDAIGISSNGSQSVQAPDLAWDVFKRFGIYKREGVTLGDCLIEWIFNEHRMVCLRNFIDEARVMRIATQTGTENYQNNQNNQNNSQYILTEFNNIVESLSKGLEKLVSLKTEV